MRCVARFGTICTIKKNMKNTHGVVLLLVKLQAKSRNPPSVFFMFFKLYKSYQIAQCTTYTNEKKTYTLESNHSFLFFFLSKQKKQKFELSRTIVSEIYAQMI